MNGRVYNPTLARFVSADPLISNPDDTQNYNRYSYVHNRPMFFTDPSGFETDDACGGICDVIELGGADAAGRTGEAKGAVITGANGEKSYLVANGDGVAKVSESDFNDVMSGDVSSAEVVNSLANSDSSTITESFGASTQSSDTTKNISSDGIDKKSYKGRNYTLNYGIEGSNNFKIATDIKFNILGGKTFGNMMLRGIAKSKKNLLISESRIIGTGESLVSGYDIYMGFSDQVKFSIGTTLGDREIYANQTMVFAHELHHVWDRATNGQAMRLGKAVDFLPERETFAVRFTNRIRQEHGLKYSRNTYTWDKTGRTYDIPIR